MEEGEVMADQHIALSDAEPDDIITLKWGARVVTAPFAHDQSGAQRLGPNVIALLVYEDMPALTFQMGQGFWDVTSIVRLPKKVTITLPTREEVADEIEALGSLFMGDALDAADVVLALLKRNEVKS